MQEQKRHGSGATSREMQNKVGFIRISRFSLCNQTSQ
jgi:hypothetical protein